MTAEAARRAYADEIAAVAHLESTALVEAFARVPREHFLGAGPWQIGRPLDRTQTYRTTVDADPRHVYHDVLIALDPTRQLNNGQPSALARWIEAMELHPGDAALHVGCGVGYYTAIIAELVGSSGRVVAYEIDPALAARAQDRLSGWPQVEVHAADGGSPEGSFDAIFINAGATCARPEWVAALGPGGRLVLPLTIHAPSHPDGGVGVMLRIDRADGRWPARVVTTCGIFDCANARDPEQEAELMALARSGALAELRAIEVTAHEKAPACLAHFPGFCLQR